MLSTVLIVLLILLLIGSLPNWGYSADWGYAQAVRSAPFSPSSSCWRCSAEFKFKPANGGAIDGVTAR
jgi:hypothetical protein